MGRTQSRMLAVLILLLAAQSARGDLALVSDRLILDAAVWTNGHFWRAEQAGLAQNEFVVERAAAPVGITGYLNPVVSLRISADVGAVFPRDLYADFRWANGFGVRAGQFVLPLGFDAMTDPREQPLVNSSLVTGYCAPAGIRDIGLMGDLQRKSFSVAVAVINGGGANVANDNPYKDVCGRATFTPFSSVACTLALRAYFGRPGSADTAWRTLAGEVQLTRGALELQSEFQNTTSSAANNNSWYLQAVWGTGLLQPVVRFDLVLPRGSHSDWMITGGANVLPLADNIRIMIDGTYRRNYQYNWSVFGFLFRIEATI
jgi:hypothetical protein